MKKYIKFLTLIAFALLIIGCSTTTQSERTENKWTEWRQTYDKDGNATKIQYSLTKIWDVVNKYNIEYICLYNGYDKPYDIRCKIYFTRKSPIELTIYAYTNKGSEAIELQLNIKELDVEKIVILDLIEK